VEPFEFISNGGGGEALPRRVKSRFSTFTRLSNMAGESNMDLNPFKYEHIFSYTVQIQRLDLIKSSPFGMRVMGYVGGGEILGPKVKGKVLPFGADWGIITTDGVVHVDVRLTLETDDNAIIYMQYAGTVDLGGPEGYERYRAENFPAKSYIQIIPIIETDHPNYLWLNRVSCFGIGRVDFSIVPVSLKYDVYAFYSLPD
jgi:hypothetical protein